MAGGLLSRLFRRSPSSTVPAPVAPDESPERTGKRGRTADELARDLHRDYGADVDVDEMITRADAAGVPLAQVDRALDDLREEDRRTVVHLEVRPADIADLRDLDSTWARIVGSFGWVTDAERSKFGGRDYVLVREPVNVHDANAVAVYGKRRKVGYLSAAKAAALAPLLDELAAGGFRVRGAGVSANSSRLWVDLPRVGALRAHVARQTR